MNTKLALVIVLVNTIESFTDYCVLRKSYPLCKSGLQEIRSEYKQRCGVLSKIPLKEIDMKEFVEAFNKIRNDVIFGGSSDVEAVKINRTNLEWNDELQKVAENIQCRCPATPVWPESIVFLEKDTNRRMKANQIILNRFGKKDLFYQLFQLFKKEAKKFNYNAKMDNTSRGPIRIFASLSDPKARFIGCARSLPLTNGYRTFKFIEHCLVMYDEDGNPNLEEKPCFTCHTDFNSKLKVVKSQRRNKRIRGIREATDLSPKRHNKPLYALSDIRKEIDCDQFASQNILCFNSTMLVDSFGNKSACKDTNLLYFKKTEKEELLDIFNTIRMEIATGESKILLRDGAEIPKVADIMELEWDDDLQDLAERTLHSCPPFPPFQFQMSFGKRLEDFVIPVTMLYDVSNATNPDLKAIYSKIITNEASKFDIKNLDKYVSDDSYDAFTIVAYAKSRYVGCARISPGIFKNKRYDYSDQCVFLPSEYKEQSLYTPDQMKDAGIYQPEQKTNNLFTPAEPCTHCPSGSECSTMYPGLCKARPKHYWGLGRPLDYCKLNKKVSCTNDPWGLKDDGKRCEEQGLLNMTQGVIQDILSLYNNYRRQLAYGNSTLEENLKPAADMMKMEWDYELQRAAELVILTCGDINEEDMKSLELGGNGEQQAQAFFVNYPGIGFEAVMDTLVNESSQFFDWNEFQNYTANADYKRMTLLLKSDTRYIGCASPLISGGQNFQTLCIVAAHEEDNNNKLYNVGPSCSKCPKGFDCDDGLCKWSPKGGIERPDNYCAIHSTHILCHEWDSRKELGDENACKKIKRLILTEKDTKELLSNYNEIRNCLTRSTNCSTKNLEWNKELQKAAQSILYSCIPENKVTPEMLQFGRYGELQAEKIIFHHNGFNFKEKLKEAVGNNETFISFTSPDARHLGCSRVAPRDSLTEITEVCVLGVLDKAQKADNFSSCPTPTLCSEALDFCFDEPSDLATSQFNPCLIATTTASATIAPTVTTSDTATPETSSPNIDVSTTTSTTTTTTTLRPKPILQPVEIFETDEEIYLPDMVLTPPQIASPPATTTASAKIQKLTSKSCIIKTRSGLVFGLLFVLHCIIGR